MMVPGDRRRTGLFLSGKPVLVKELNIAITPPTIAEITMFGEDDFLFCSQLIANTDSFVEQVKRGNSELELFSDFQLLMKLIKEDNQLFFLIENFLDFIFPDYKIFVQENVIDLKIVQDEKEKIVGRITPFNYDALKNIIKILFLNQTSTSQEIEYNPANELAEKIANKIKAGRRKKQELQTEENKDQSIFAQMCSILSIGLQMDINIFFNYTPFQLWDAYSRFFMKQSYDFYQKVSTTPLMDVSKMEQPEEWTKFNY